MAVRDIYLKIETILGYSPVEPDDHVSPPIQYGRDCMRNDGHEDGSIPAAEIAARRLTALIYREYLDPNYLIPKPDKLIAADINEPAFPRRVPGTVIYARPGDRLRIHVKNADSNPHSFHIHGVRYGIDSDGSWPFGTQSSDGRRSDEICPGQTWTYTYDVTEESVGAWPFHEHWRSIGAAVNRGLFGGLVVVPAEHPDDLPAFPYPPGFEERLQEALKAISPGGREGMAPEMAMGPLALGAMPGMATQPAMTPPMQMPRMGLDLSALPESLVPFAVDLDELAHAPQPLPDPECALHVPLFFHQMAGQRTTPLFQSAPLNPGATFSTPPLTVAGTYNYICGIHGAIMSGSVTVQPGGASPKPVSIVDFAFSPANVTVGIGGIVIWTNGGPSQHSVLETGGDSMPSFCLNGRSFVGNTPTIVATAGQRIRWYVYNLDLSMAWHNFHTHAQRWTFGDQVMDVRSLSPAESFVAETTAPPVLLLPPDIAHQQDPKHRPKGAKPYHLRGDFLVHCHVEMHMMAGLVSLLRSQQTVWLTPQQAAALAASSGLPLDPGDNACPNVQLDRCAAAVGGTWEELPGLPEITFMHAVLLAGSSRLLYWGYGQRPDQTRLWDQTTGAYTQPANQPIALAGDENIWSGAHAQLPDGSVLVHGGFMTGPGIGPQTERRAFIFNPATNTFSPAAELTTGRFYPTTLTLPDGTAMTLYGQDHAGGGATAASLEVFTPGGAGTWSPPKPLPFNYFYYPWTFLLPGGDAFVAGPQKPARRFNPSAAVIVDDPARQYNQIASQRGVNMDGTAVLLALRPPDYKPRVMVLGGSAADAQQTAEWIDLSVPNPAWTALPNLSVPRDKVNSVLLPDGRVVVVGGIETLPDGGPVEIFDPDDPTTGFIQGPHMQHIRGYHSAAILMPDGSVIVGGDPNGGTTPNERYLPSYFAKGRPAIGAAPPTLTYGTSFSVTTPLPAAIAHVVLMRAGAVTHGFNHNQRLVECAITGTSATGVTAMAPPNGSVAPPGHYLLFILDQDRVPSLGAWTAIS